MLPFSPLDQRPQPRAGACWFAAPRPAVFAAAGGTAQPLLGPGAAALDRRSSLGGDRPRVGGSKSFLTYLALIAVPPLAALALAAIVRGGRPPLALLGHPPLRPRLGRQGLAERANGGPGALRLGLRQPRLAARLRRPRSLAQAGDLRDGGDRRLAGRHPACCRSRNAVLNAASPGGGLPRLQFVAFGSAVMGFGDIFLAAVLGALLAS